jgi:hypothetical protein
VSVDAGADAGSAVTSRAREVRGGSPSCVGQAVDATPKSLRGCVKPLSEYCDLPGVPVPAGEPLAMSRACPRFSDVLEETDRASERASIAECKNGRVIRVWGSYGATVHYFDACDRLVGVAKTFDSKSACNKTSFGISLGRTELQECVVTERLATASAVRSSEPEIVAAAAALGAVSLSGCTAPSHDSARAPATVYVTATFETDGRISAVRVGAAPPSLQTSCVESTVRLAHIAPFSGSPISVGAHYVLR